MSADQRPPSKPPHGRVPLDTMDKLDSLRPSSLPPELGDLDFRWDDDLVAHGNRRNRPLLSPLELDLELDEGDRPTAVPEIPMEQFVQRAMAEVDRQEQEQALRGSKTVLNSGFISGPPTLGSLSGPPTLSQGRGPVESVVSTEPVPQAPVSLSTQPPASAKRQFDPLALDISEMELNGGGTAFPPTEPPIEIPFKTTVAPADDDPQRHTEANPANAVDLSQLEESSRPAMKDRYAIGDFSGALEIAESLLSLDPSDLEAQRYATSCRDVLTQMYLSRLGGLDQVINMVLPPEELRWLNLDHRAGFLLSLVDGVSTIEELLDICGMSRLDALRILATLREQRAILLSSR